MADILVVDDQDRTHALCRRMMPEHDWWGPAHSWAEARQALKERRGKVDLVLLDMHFDLPASELVGLPDGADETAVRQARRRQGMAILEELRRGHPDLPVVLMTAREDTQLEKAADRLGAEEYTYFLDDEDLDAGALRQQVEGILQARRGTDRDGPVYWGRSLVMRRIRQRLGTLARGRLPVILTGPTGTGKSLVARHFLHPKSGRKGKFVAVDLSTLPRDLVAAHLFGSVRGAYTGSVADRRGAFEEADGGTLFLDEVGNLDPDVQRMLLTVLQDGEVTRLGDTVARSVDVKLVVATNEDLPVMVREGRFRADLFMRLNPGCTVELPALVDRKMDMDKLLGFAVERALGQDHVKELLAEYALRSGIDANSLQIVFDQAVPEGEKGTLVFLFPKQTMSLVKDHRWPGNLRELVMTVENAVTLTVAEALETGVGQGRRDVLQIRPKTMRDLLVAAQSQEKEEAGWATKLRVRSHDGLNKVAQDVERQYFTQLYVLTQGDFAAMASVLLGDADGARKVQLRFNQLGLKVRDLKELVV